MQYIQSTTIHLGTVNKRYEDLECLKCKKTTLGDGCIK